MGSSFKLKAISRALLQRCEHIAATEAPITEEDSRNLARNHQEDRRVEVYAPGAALDAGEWGALVAAIVCVTPSTLIRSAATGLWKRREETSFYASSVMLPAEIFASAIRGHWAVESENHWARDVTLAEDASRIRVNPGVMARLRSQALNIARANGVTNIAQAPLGVARSIPRHTLLPRPVKSIEQACRNRDRHLTISDVAEP